MAEDQCLIQYVRDNFGHEFLQNYVNFVEGETSYGLDYNAFTESSAFAGPSSPVTALAPDLFGSSPSLSVEAPLAMESTPFLENATDCFSLPGEPGLQVPSVLGNLQLARPLLNEREYPVLASYGLAQTRQPEHGLRSQGFEAITLDELLQDQFVASCKSTSGISYSATDGERATNFWRGKSPALLMQQLKGPSLSASSSTSEARSNLKSPSFLQSSSAPNPTTLAPRTNLSATSLCNRVGEITSYTFGALSPVEPVSQAAPTFRKQRSLPTLGEINNDINFKNILSSGKSSFGSRVLHSGSSFKGDGESLQGSVMQGRQSMPGLTQLGEMQRIATSGNNSWSSSNTSPGRPSDVKHDKELLAANLDWKMQKNSYHSSMSPAMPFDRQLSGDRVWKKAKAGELEGSAVSDDAVQAAILATAMVEQKEKNQLRDKFLALLQIDSSTSKDYKAQILDDTIRYLKDLRRRLNFNETDSTPDSRRMLEPGFSSFNSTEASPTSSSRCRPYGESLPGAVRLKDLELETAGVEISPHLSVSTSPHIEVRMMEDQHVMVKLATKDRPGLFNDIAVVLRSLRLDIQHANIRTGNNGQRHDIFAAKMQLPVFSSQSTHSIAMALDQVVRANSAIPLTTPQLHVPHI